MAINRIASHPTPKIRIPVPNPIVMIPLSKNIVYVIESPVNISQLRNISWIRITCMHHASTTIPIIISYPLTGTTSRGDKTRENITHKAIVKKKLFLLTISFLFIF
ncbi:MAG: hypothetical protein QXU21_05495 [Candidatus Bathyarchaeia archaeon]